MRISIVLALVSTTLASPPAITQDQQTDEPVSVMPSTRTVEPPVIGQRQSRELLSQDAGIEPMARINGRIQNRVQSRIRNRIDRYYDPQANAVSPFEVAGDQARTAGRPRR